MALCVQISVAGANKVEGTMSWCEEPMRFWHLNIRLLC